jgi:hypothetical protein
VKKHLVLMLFAFLVILSMGAVAQAQTTDEAEEIDTEDWLRIEGNGVALKLPLNFQGGDLEEVIELVSENIDMLGDGFDMIAPILESNPEIFKLYAFDPELLPNGGLTNVNITAVPLPMRIDMEELLELTASQYPRGFDITETDVIELGEYEDVGRLLIEAEVMGFEQTVLQYAFHLDEVLYSVTYTTATDVFEDLLPIFEASAETFEVVEDK